MSTIEIPVPTKVTAADLLAMPDEKSYELIAGALEAKNVGFDSCWIAMNLVGFLVPYCRQMKLGWVLGPDAGYQCFPDDPQKVRKPDVSFISLHRIPADQTSLGFIPIAPDLAVEVVSLNDLAAEINQKVNQYLAAGVPMVSVDYPTSAQVVVFRQSGAKVPSSHAQLTGEEVVPGFKLQLTELFRKPGE